MPTVHELKTWPLGFSAILGGAKHHEVRKDDRNFQVGDLLRLREWEPGNNRDEYGYTGRELLVVVSHKTPGGAFGLPEGVCVLSIMVVPDKLDEQTIQVDSKAFLDTLEAVGLVAKPLVTAMDNECASCGEEVPEKECDQSQRPCGHHCNHSWSHDKCCWCSVSFGDDGEEIVQTGNPRLVLKRKVGGKAWESRLEVHSQGESKAEAVASVLGATRRWALAQQEGKPSAEKVRNRERFEKFLALAKKLGPLPTSIMATREPLDEDKMKAVLESVERDIHAPDDGPPDVGSPNSPEAVALGFLLRRLGALSSARWDQWLRHEFGDDKAEAMIAAVRHVLGE